VGRVLRTDKRVLALCAAVVAMPRRPPSCRRSLVVFLADAKRSPPCLQHL